jgi:CDP-glycerol glycerophosphotransferase (TagB/SpsB family)
VSAEILCYCYHVSHVLNLGDIPAQLASRGWRVRWFNAFAPEAFPLNHSPAIEYAFNVPLEAIGRESADLYLTPYVGQNSHFPQRARRVHFLVSLTSLDGVYDKSMFDHYDVIVCAGRHHVEDFIALGAARRWTNKLLMPVGYPKLDGQRRRLAQSGAGEPDALTVVFAPTHAYYVNHELSVLNRYGEQIVTAMIENGIRVIFRPHVESWRDQDRGVVDRIVRRFDGHPGFVLDRSGDYFDTFARSHLMLTDVSGTGFTYAFTYGRPALFFAPNVAAEAGLKGIQFDRRDNIGLLVRSIDDLTGRLRLAHRHRAFLQQQIADFRNWLIFNPDSSEAFFAEHAERLLHDCVQLPGWHTIQHAS